MSIFSVDCKVSCIALNNDSTQFAIGSFDEEANIIACYDCPSMDRRDGFTLSTDIQDMIYDRDSLLAIDLEGFLHTVRPDISVKSEKIGRSLTRIALNEYIFIANELGDIYWSNDKVEFMNKKIDAYGIRSIHPFSDHNCLVAGSQLRVFDCRTEKAPILKNISANCIEINSNQIFCGTDSSIVSFDLRNPGQVDTLDFGASVLKSVDNTLIYVSKGELHIFNDGIHGESLLGNVTCVDINQDSLIAGTSRGTVYTQKME